MARVKMLVHMQGTDCERKVGLEYDVDDAEAGRLIKAGFASAVDGDEFEDEPAAKKPASEGKPKKPGRKKKEPGENATETGEGAAGSAAE